MIICPYLSKPAPCARRYWARRVQYYTAPQRQLPFSVLIIKAPCGSATAARQLPPSGHLFETFTRQGPRYRAI